jgi:uncharacterized protein YkuJ
MTINSFKTGARCVMAAALLQLFVLTAVAAEAEFSQAETLLWMTDQLKMIEQPLQLNYAFERTGTFEPGFSDKVTFTVRAVKDDGTKAASVDFFTGERRFEVPPVESTNVNPILKIYLQGDVYEMNRLTDPDGKSRERWRYFQRRIKFAMADAASIENVTVNFNGEAVPAVRVSFSPYANDPKRALFEEFADKSYRIVVSDKIPGYIYSIETVIPGAGPDDLPLIREFLQLVSVEPGTAAQSAALTK